jgi:hypothetical protein
MKKLTVLLTALFLFTASLCGGSITLDFSVHMNQLTDSNSNIVTTFQPFDMNVQTVLDDTFTYASLLGPTDTSFIFGDGTQIYSPLSQLFSMGYDKSMFTPDSGITDVLISAYTYTSVEFGNGGYYESATFDAAYEYLGYDSATTATPLPKEFGSADLQNLLLADVGQQFSYIESMMTWPIYTDSDGRQSSAGIPFGYQFQGDATLTSVTLNETPEPSTMLMALPLLLFFLNKIRR